MWKIWRKCVQTPNLVVGFWITLFMFDCNPKFTSKVTKITKEQSQTSYSNHQQLATSVEDDDHTWTCGSLL